MKKVIFISGTMGSGKSTVSRLCSEQLTRSVWLDGDWCWMMHPFQVNDQTKAMVLNNITYLLNQFLALSLIHILGLHQADNPVDVEAGIGAQMNLTVVKGKTEERSDQERNEHDDQNRACPHQNRFLFF